MLVAGNVRSDVQINTCTEVLRGDSAAVSIRDSNGTKAKAAQILETSAGDISEHSVRALV